VVALYLSSSTSSNIYFCIKEKHCIARVLEAEASGCVLMTPNHIYTVKRKEFLGN
jgi:hypothetical protein